MLTNLLLAVRNQIRVADILNCTESPNSHNVMLHTRLFATKFMSHALIKCTVRSCWRMSKLAMSLLY